VGPRAGLYDMEKRKFLTLPGLELRPLGRPARSQSLYRLRYPGSQESELIKRTPWFQSAKRTIPTERPPLVGEVNAHFSG
jgi:hypothetical protein